MEKTSMSKLIKASILGIFVIVTIFVTAQYFNSNDEQASKENPSKSGPVHAVATAKIGSMGSRLRFVLFFCLPYASLMKLSPNGSKSSR